MAENQSYGNNLFTPKNILIYLVIGGLIYAAIYFLVLKKDNNSYMAPAEQTSQEQSENSMTITLGAQNDSGESGTATLSETDGKTKVVVDVGNAPSGVPQPAHIHTGACPTPGGIVYPLTNLIDGTSETVLDVDLATLKSQLPLALNVHKSAEESNAYVSCGDLQ